MKKISILFCTILFFLVSASVSAQSISFEPSHKGRFLPTPVNTERLESSIRLSLALRGWTIKEDTPGLKVARFEKNGGKIFAEIGIVYDAKGYSIEYRDSKNIKADLKNLTIHRNYVKWVANLDKLIYKNYISADK